MSFAVDAVDLQLIGTCLLIFAARLSDMTLATLRVILVFRGRSALAAAIGFFEILIYMYALGKVVSALGEPLQLFCFALGFASGTYVGAWVEGRLALGQVTVQVIPSKADEAAWRLDERLRGHGLGVTTVTGEGRSGERPIHLISLPRRRLKDVLRLLDQEAPDAFITIMDATARGGFLGNAFRKSK